MKRKTTILNVLKYCLNTNKKWDVFTPNYLNGLIILFQEAVFKIVICEEHNIYVALIGLQTNVVRKAAGVTTRTDIIWKLDRIHLS